MQTNQQKGIVLGLTAYFIWSLFPFYFKELSHYHAIEVIGHRLIWTCVLLLLFLILKKHWQAITLIKQNPKIIFWTFISGVLIAINWLTYVWAVGHDRIIDASLGYFISPLMGVALSFFILKERLRPLQFLAIALAFIAVFIQVVMLGFLPIVSLLLALSFAFYGLMQKRTPLDSISALFLETAMLVPFCVVWFMTHDVPSSEPSFWVSHDIWLLMLAGPITLIPLLLYNQSTKLVNFNTLSFMQYITPTSVFMIAVFYYHEPIDSKRLLVFGLIWLGLIIFSIDILKHRKSS
ncbi:putative chloramphenical resistance permease RarD [Moraxella lacunata]|uniref:Putative chloramphenical resistance permease RarD n=2 Tax=Moraxella lacunata TaxID=477 RepID=A0A378TTK9_MORLA|nr:EamA family transporter RarD [Moraxella lacunata]STZ63644.1 putative chloramphenical resistance permease RarD [Moraxella lacunata]